MQIRARVESRRDQHHVTLCTDEQSHALVIPPKPSGYGSSANGGELLALALATCYCNDLYREAFARGITVHSVGVEVEAEFGVIGEPARQIRYRVAVSADAEDGAIHDLVAHTDRVAEIHDTLRAGIAVELENLESGSSPPPPAA